METEIKLYMPNLDVARQHLESAGAQLDAPRVLERNWRYDTPDKRLSADEQVLRLRQDARTRLTYKGKGASQAGITSRPEYEVEVSDFEAMAQILHGLGYETYMLYEKYRTTYLLDGAEIVLDELPYGNFVEIEADAKHIERLIVRLGWADAPRFAESYARIFERIKIALNLRFEDLTFANFAGISVPPEFFKR